MIGRNHNTLGHRSMIDFVIVSSDLLPYVVDTQVKREAEQSTDQSVGLGGGAQIWCT